MKKRAVADVGRRPESVVGGVSVSGVSHSYGGRMALVDVSCELPVGVTGLLGPNGAGKSTLMTLLATAVPLRNGSIRFGDIEVGAGAVERVRGLIGYLPQRFEVMELASVRRNVAYAAWAHGLGGDGLEQAVDDALALFDLADRVKSRARSLSGGMRQRLGLACALVHRPPVVILDEPTVGLDPVQRAELRRSIVDLGQHSAVLVSTHLVEDLAGVAERVLVIHQGRLRFSGSVEELRDLGQGGAEQRPDGVVESGLAGSVSSPLEAGYAAALGLAA